eukprot:scaffold132691_cov63-Phaeocystis_antarctica.AAC.1
MCVLHQPPRAPSARQPAACDGRPQRRLRLILDEAADNAAKADVRNDRLVLQFGACGWRGVLGVEPLRDGRALVGEPIRRADGVGHDLGRDRAHVVVGHLCCLAHLRQAGRPAAAALAVFGHGSLQRFGLRRSHCRRLPRRRHCRRRCRRRCHGLLTRLRQRRRPRPNPHHIPHRHLLRPLRCRQHRRLCRRILHRLTLGLLQRLLQQPVAQGLRLHAHAALPHLAWRRCERQLERRQPAACDGRPQRRPRPLCSRFGLGCGGGRRGEHGCRRRLARLVICGGDGATCLLLLLGLLRAGLHLGPLRCLLGQQLIHCRIRPRRLCRLRHFWCHGGAQRRYVLSDEGCDGRFVLQGLHARLFPVGRSHHQGGHAVAVLQVRVGRVLQQDGCGGEVAGICRSHERGDAEAGRQVDARASLQQHPHHLMVTELASLGRHVDLDGKRVRHGLPITQQLRMVRWGGKRGAGILRRRCVLPDELCGGCLTLGLGPLQGGLTLFGPQLGVGLGSQQGRHVHLVPLASGLHQGGVALDVLQVRVGRVLQEDE